MCVKHSYQEKYFSHFSCRSNRIPWFFIPWTTVCTWKSRAEHHRCYIPIYARNSFDSGAIFNGNYENLGLNLTLSGNIISIFHSCSHTLCKNQRSLSHPSACNILRAPIHFSNYRRLPKKTAPHNSKVIKNRERSLGPFICYVHVWK